MRMRPTKDFQQTQSWYRHVVLPCLVIVIVAVVLVATLSSNFFCAMMIKEIYQNHLDSLETINNSYEEIRFNALPTVDRLFGNINIQNYLFARNNIQEDSLNALSTMDNILPGNAVIHSLYLYNSTYGYLSTVGGLEGTTCITDPGLEQFLESEPKRMNIILRQTQFTSNTDYTYSKRKLNIYSVVIWKKDVNSGKLQYALILNISDLYERNRFIDSGSSSMFYIIDDTHRFITNPDPEMFGKAYADDSVFARIRTEKGKKGTFLFQQGKENYIACWFEQPETQWRLIYIVPYTTILNMVRQVRRTTILIVSIVLLVSICILLLLGWKNAKIVGLERRLKDYIQGSGSLGIVPFALGQTFSLVLFRMDKQTGTKQSVSDAQQRGVFFRHLPKPAQTDFLFRLDCDVFCFMTVRACDEVRSFFVSLQRTYQEETHSDLTAVVGTHKVLLEDIPHTVQKQKDILNDLFLNHRGVVETDMIAFNHCWSYPPLDLQAYTRAFTTNRSDEYRKEANLLLDELSRRDNYVYAESVCVRMAFLVHHFANRTLELFLPQGVDGWYRTTVDCMEVSAMREQFDILADAMAASQEANQNDRQKELVKAIQSYITEHLTDKNLNAAMIADAFNFSINYLRVVFKEKRGHSLNDEIGLARFEKAKELLAQTGYPVKQICDKVGFGNYSYFCTYFKSIEGKTPSQYRTHLRLSK